MPAAKSVAVVGSGISGLGAAWMLVSVRNRKIYTLDYMCAPRSADPLACSCLMQNRAGWSVTLYEKEDICGGHTLTDETEKGCPVDLGFQVFNQTNYPHLMQLFEALGVDSYESDMSFSLSAQEGQLEWASHGLGSFFVQKSNLCSPSFMRMFVDMLRFNRQVRTRAVCAHSQWYGHNSAI